MKNTLKCKKQYRWQPQNDHRVESTLLVFNWLPLFESISSDMLLYYNTAGKGYDVLNMVFVSHSLHFSVLLLVLYFLYPLHDGLYKVDGGPEHKNTN